MAKRNYIVREGFVLWRQVTNDKGSTTERFHDAGETVALDDDEAAMHGHKLELADEKDRAAALKAEKIADVANKANMAPADLVAALAAAIAQQGQQAPAA